MLSQLVSDLALLIFLSILAENHYLYLLFSLCQISLLLITLFRLSVLVRRPAAAYRTRLRA
jgi:hypothetical protein